MSADQRRACAERDHKRNAIAHRLDALIEAGFTDVPIHPNVVKATRPRFRSHDANYCAPTDMECLMRLRAEVLLVAVGRSALRLAVKPIRGRYGGGVELICNSCRVPAAGFDATWRRAAFCGPST